MTFLSAMRGAFRGPENYPSVNKKGLGIPVRNFPNVSRETFFGKINAFDPSPPLR
jgi:hypothetical protein